MKSRLPLTSFCMLLVLSCAASPPAPAQTYDVNGQAGSSSNEQNNSSIGWGSSIEVARQARAAQDALKRNDYAAAVSFAERAAKSAPQNAELWFLLGYAARLNQQYQVSVDAYNRGLQLRPNSAGGMAGLAQTYARMGRDAEAEKLLQRVVDANPKDANSLQLAGELLLSSDPKRSLEMLQRADSVKPSAHNDLLIAHAFERLGQPEETTKYLNRAKNRAPKDPEVLRAVAGQYREQGEYEKAISTLQSIPSKSVDIQAELAYTFQLAGKLQEAAALYSKLAKAAKGNISLDLSAAQAWVNMGQADGATVFLDDARKIDANNYRLHAILGSIAESQDRLSDATSEYAQAIRNLPPRVPEGALYPVELRLNLYELAVRQDDQAAAKQHLDAASSAINQVKVNAAPKPEMLRLRAAIEAASGDLDAANRDIKEALSLEPSNVNSLLNYGSLQWKLGQKDAARDTFAKALEIDKNNRTALSSLGYLARDKGDVKQAESYFARAASAHPKDYAPYLALGDLYTAEHNLRAAETNYQAAYQRMPTNAMTVAGGANAALESRNLDLAKRWLDRSEGKMNDIPQVQRERERYLTLKGQYEESAALGQKVLARLPNDREGVVYLAYDLYYLGRYADAAALVSKYEPIFSDDKDLALISGYLNVRDHKLQEALADFTKALQRDPRMATGYVNRGFVLNDLKEPEKAANDFKVALQLQPNYGEAHLGLAYADLQLHRPKAALNQLEAAQKALGKTHVYHLARAEAFRQEQDYAHAEPEYRAALQEIPNDVPTQLAYADTLYRMRRYQQALEALDAAQKLAPTEAKVYAEKAQVHARAGSREDVIRDVQQAEQFGGNDVDILMATGDAMLTLGDRDAAMQRFSRALEVPKGDRLGVRLAVAQVFMRQGRYDDARRQIALGFAEARVNSSDVTGQDILEAANVFLAMHDFDLAATYLDKARLAGANPRMVAIGLTNTYLAQGETRRAEVELSSLGSPNDFRDDYDYMMASANLHRQRQDTVQALSEFAQASTVAGQDDAGRAQTAQYEMAGIEGRQITQNLSILPEAFFGPAFEDINVYALDAKLLNIGTPGLAANPALLPPPRYSYQNLALSHYRLHLGNLPVISGFAGESMTRGRLLFPSTSVVQSRNTYDTMFNVGISPILHIGPSTISFTGGIQYTLRRDTISPFFMNQNLFRQFLYVSTSSLFNWVSINGTAIREAGPYTDQNLHSRDLSGSLEFLVGRPWGRTALLAGYSARDLLFRPLISEYFNTTSYVGLQHKFGNRLTMALLAEDLRSWRVQGVQFATAQAFLPGARFELRATPHWSVQGSFLLSQGKGYHEYDNAQSEFLISYMRPMRGSVRDGSGDVPVAYPFRFSVGVQQQTFYNFGTQSKTNLLPVVHFTLF